MTTAPLSLYVERISKQTGIGLSQVKATIELFEDRGTIPFIARYRKEATGSLDEVAIESIQKQFNKLQELEKRKESILESLLSNGQLTDNLKTSIAKVQTLPELEDIYLPYRPKRKTRAAKAKERGLAPLGVLLRKGEQQLHLQNFVKPELDVHTKEDALSGARDIIAEEIAEAKQTREQLRILFKKEALLSSKVVTKKKDIAAKFKDYFNWQEAADKAAGHRLLAMLRGQREKLLKLTARPPLEKSLALLHSIHLTKKKFSRHKYQSELTMALEDSYNRLIGPSLETELLATLKLKAEEEAIGVFSLNLRQLLLSPPLGHKSVLAIDPGYRTGCKTVCLDKQGNLLEHTTIFLGSKQQKGEAETLVKKLVQQHNIDAIAIGNGTAGRDTEQFIRGLGLENSLIITMVNEDGASVYSASEIAREEFADHDITVRGAVSIGRRLQDPLAELVKIDPKSIGVGQYQHDVNQRLLREALQNVVESCVNSVGVELNSASVPLLSHVAGLNTTIAKNIVAYRNSHGPFRSRLELKKVPRLGPKTFEQCAGFLRINGGTNPLDNSGVHPERYTLVERMAKDCHLSVADLLSSSQARDSIDLNHYCDHTIGLPTLNDIMTELSKPGRDPRQEFEQFQFSDSVQTIDDLHEGMSLPAIITNITKFGAFADVGIKQDGLIHISQLADRFVKDVGEIVQIGQKVMVRVLEIDIERNRIALSMKST